MYPDFYVRFNKPANLLLVAIVLFCILYISSVQKLVFFWASSEYTYSHGKLLFFLCAYYFYKSWKADKNELEFSFSLSGLLLLLAVSFVWLASKIIFVDTVELLSFPFLLMFLFVSLLGWRQSKNFMFPILLMLLGLPLFEWVVPVLQSLTAVMVGVLLDVSGVTSIVEGVLILIPAGTFEVDNGCSGLNVFMVGLILSSLYAYINGFILIEGAVLFLLSMAVSILSNVIRVYIVVFAGNETQMQHPLVNDHANLGWVVFIIIMGAFFFLVNRFWPAPKTLNIQDNQSEIISNKNGLGEWHFKQAAPGVVLTLVGVAIAPLLLMFVYQQHNESDFIGNHGVPETINSWVMSNDVDGRPWEVKFHGGEGTYAVNRQFINDVNESVFLNVRYFSRQHVGNEAINVTNSVYDRNVWTRVWVGSYASQTEDDLPKAIEETLVRNIGSQEILIWRWYSVFGKNTGNPYVAKIYNLLSVLMGEPEIAVFVVSTKVTQSFEDSRKILENFGVAISHITPIN